MGASVADGATIQLVGDQTRRAACALVMQAPERWVVTIDQPRRTLQQSSRFWATCSDVAKSELTWGGTRQDKESWHDLFLSGWHVIKDHPPRLLIGIEGERVSLVRHTRTMNQTDMSELLDYASAWCAMRNISLRE
jgi:hypothetical protein